FKFLFNCPRFFEHKIKDKKRDKNISKGLADPVQRGRNVGNCTVQHLHDLVIGNMEIKPFEVLIVLQKCPHSVVFFNDTLTVAQEFIDFWNQDLQDDPERHRECDNDKENDERDGKIAVPLFFLGVF